MSIAVLATVGLAAGDEPPVEDEGAMAQQITLTAKELYAGFEARRVRLTDGGLAVDNRAQTDPPTPAQITTDVINLAGQGVLTEDLTLLAVAATALSNATAAEKVTVEVAAGSTFFQRAGTWSEFAPKARIEPGARYVQFRVTVLTTRADFRLTGLRVDYSHAPLTPRKAKLSVVEDKVQRIVRSSIAFGYQRPDHPDLVWLRETFKLEEVVAGKKSEMEKLFALCTWVGSRKNDRTRGWNKLPYYPWNVRRLLVDTDGGTIYGHCGSYCAVFIACCNALGWQGRHYADQGYKRRSHEVAEIYVSELGRWVYFDPSLATYYVNRTTGEPLDIVQMHDIYLDTHFNQAGDTVPKIERDYDELKRRRAKIDWDKYSGKPVSTDWVYGERKKWGWDWGQGIVTTAWLQMTPRCNFYDKPEPIFKRFGHNPSGGNGFPVWVDARTPPRTRRSRNFFTRRRDFYWTLNQASVRLVRTGEGTVAVELGNSQPFFKQYLVTLNGQQQTTADSTLAWKLQPGRNTLEVQCEDEFGRKGAVSRVVVERAGA